MSFFRSKMKQIYKSNQKSEEIESMNFEIFIKEVKQMVKEYLGDTVRVEDKTVLKNNGVKLTGIVIMEGEHNCVPNIYLNNYYEQFKNGRCLRDIVYEITEYYEKHKICKHVNMDGFSDFEQMKDSICFRLIHLEKNKELLEQIPHIPYLDMAIVFYCVVQNEYIGSGTILVRNEHLKKWQVNTEILQKLAFNNTPKKFKGEITPMEDVICVMIKRRLTGEIERSIREQLDTNIKVTDEMVEPIVREMVHNIYSEAKGPKMYVLSNTERNFGAAVVLYDSFLETFAEETKSDYYILPSSIHEMILVPVGDDENEVERLKKMVCEVNYTELSAEEILSDSVYLFKRDKGIITSL